MRRRGERPHSRFQSRLHAQPRLLTLSPHSCSYRTARRIASPPFALLVPPETHVGTRYDDFQCIFAMNRNASLLRTGLIDILFVLRFYSTGAEAGQSRGARSSTWYLLPVAAGRSIKFGAGSCPPLPYMKKLIERRPRPLRSARNDSSW
ncbi:hypothetical protein HYPSUDRAFT_358067 [Hypholoma sublateritium FD-334 SS-4]|uniref:Uncharacterized protein n=1 Tax=Hypholoma sublateritium (strain FD-334 SS-4) TaxID=945553 RepID=A0A0D2LXX6_HYPSF|nr:hypothetical protein HYPSUDRAFT_358067 [Hypholoma sublateritium FD-334 SS-4]